MAFKTDLNEYIEDISLGRFQDKLPDANRQNRFMVDFSQLVGKFEDIVSSADLNDIRFHVTASPIPGRSVGTVNASWYGMSTTYAGNHEPQTWTTTFISDIDYKAEKFIDGWLNKIQNLSTNTKGTPNQYKNGCEILVHQLNGAGIITSQTRLMNIYPTAKSERSASVESAEFQTYTVTWSFDYPLNNFE